MTQAQQPVALQLANIVEQSEGWTAYQAAAELRRQHARIAELEAQLSAIGAGGVEPLRKAQAVPVPAGEYPPLPKPARPGEPTSPYPAAQKSYWTEAQIYEAIDSDRAMRAQAQIADLDEDLDRTLKERDTAEEWADGLSELIGKHFGRDIGEHSSAHCPWQAAKEIIEDAEPHIAAHRPAAHECREALAACINLLKKTPKITRDIYVGKDRQAWGVQAKAVLDAAVAALNQETEK